MTDFTEATAVRLLSKPGVLLTTFIGIGLSVAFFTYRRLYNELQKFPGPKLAAITRFYNAYFDLVKDGEWVEHLEELHCRYGPVVRTGPLELHFNDPQAYADIYNSTTKFPKDPYYYKAFAMENVSFSMTDPEDSRLRRNILGPLFSKKAVDSLEGVMQQKVDHFVQHLARCVGPVDLSSAFRSANLDIIASYCVGRPYGAITYPNFRHPLLLGMESSVIIHMSFRHFRFLKTLSKFLPAWVQNFLFPNSRGFVAMRGIVETQLDKLLVDPSLSKDEEKLDTIFKHFLEPQETPSGPRVLSRNELLDECVNMILAGIDTTGNTLTVGTFHVLSNPRVHRRVVEELDEAWTDLEEGLGYSTLSRLPYLTAVIKESLRLAHGVVTPMPRVISPSSTKIAGIDVPAGTVVSMGTTFMHLNPAIFPDPHTFDPDRWLQTDASRLDSYLVPFSRGPRACVAINLAWCELYLIFASAFRKLDFEIHETTAKDFEFGAYYLPKYRGRPFRARVTSRLR